MSEDGFDAVGNAAAWDELYDTRDGKPALPPPPVSPRRRRARKRIAVLLVMVLLALGLGAGGLALALRSVSSLLEAIAAGDVAALQGRVDWPELTNGLRGQLDEMARPRTGETRQAQDYLRRLAEVTIDAESQPELLARTIRGRAFGTRQSADRARPDLLGALGPVRLPGGGVARLDFVGDRSSFPTGISLCLRPGDGNPFDLRLFRLGWPELNRRC